MLEENSTKNFGAYMDRTIKAIKANYTLAFKTIGADITTEQWVIIDLLNEKNGLSQNELANQTFKNAPTVSRIIDLLCKKGLTKRLRYENDRRRYKVFLTEEGQKLHNQVFPKVIELRKKGWSKLTDEDYQSYLRILNQIFENFSHTESE